MGLEIFSNRTGNTHENEQFRRVVNILEGVFSKFGYTGLLLGNPHNETFLRFRADAILLYDHGLVIIDFKDYQGKIKLPPNADEFHLTKWYTESDKDRTRIEIKAGNKYINPFRQLKAYREVFYEIVDNTIDLKGKLNPSKTCIANIFSGPFQIINEIPRNLPYYKLLQESNLGEFLYDFASENKYTPELAQILLNLFPAEKWVNDFTIIKEEAKPEKIMEIEEGVEKEIESFLKEEGGGMLVLESMNSADRDSWMKYLLREATNFNIPQVETWCHSSRISKKIQDRTNVQTLGVYSVIYGGSHKIEGVNDNKIEDEEAEENLMEVIPIRSNDSIDEKALVIIHEAHLINRSLNQSDLLKFGTGRLLEDMLRFINPASDRKIILIGDPYSLTYGKNEDSALDLNTLTELYTKSIRHYRKAINPDYSDCKEKLTIDLAQSIENKLFHQLDYSFGDNSLAEVNRPEIQQKLQLWFDKPLLTEPDKAILFYSKKDCLKTNKWIKKSYLKNGEKLAPGDLLIVHNNVSIPDDTGFQNPKRIVNGMYLSVLEVKENLPIEVPTKYSANPVMLSFTKLSVKCLSLHSAPETDLWMLDNFFHSEEGMAKEERIAFRIFVNGKIDQAKAKRKFEDSSQYKLLMLDSQYKDLSDDEHTAIGKLVKNYSLPKNNKEKVKTTEKARKILSYYNQLYTKDIFDILRETDPYVNAVNVEYGWAITVHKAIGSSFDEVIIKGHRKENDGVTNDSYFRWLYSGISASKRMVGITSPQRIHPFMYCTFEDRSITGTVTEKTRENNFLSFKQYKEESRFTDKVNFLENDHVKGAICEFSKILEQRGYLLDSTKKLNGYLTKAIYSIPESANKQLILNIDNKGAANNEEVSSIRIDRFEGADHAYITASIKEFFENHQPSEPAACEEVEFPKDFRKEIYTDWIEKLGQCYFNVRIIKSHDNQDIFIAQRDNDKIKFRVWYGTSELNHTKGFINKIEVLEKENDSLTEELKERLFNDSIQNI